MRNESLDIFRLLAAFAVVILHVQSAGIPMVAEDNLRLLARFAVPFFFLVSGYHFYENFIRKGDACFTKSIQRLMSVFIVACVVYYTIRFQRVHITFSLLYYGTNIHLWFLSSMILGLIVCWYNYSYLKSGMVLNVLSVTIIAMVLVSDSYNVVFLNNLDGDFCRYLLSIPCLYAGTLIAKNEIRVGRLVSVVLIVLGIILQVAESLVLRRFGYDVFMHQFLIGTIPFALGMFFLSFNGLKNHRLAVWGRIYSLPIYLYHQFVFFFVAKVIKRLFPLATDSIFIFSPVIAFGSTLLALMIVSNYLPRIFSVLNGELTSITGMAKRRTVYPVLNYSDQTVRGEAK